MFIDLQCIDPTVESYLPRLVHTVEKLDRRTISNYVGVLDAVRRREADVWFCGNGGAASTASHVICELNKEATGPAAPRFKAHSLTDSVSTLLAYADDHDYGEIFVEQLKNFLEPEDVLVAICGHGNSRNVIRAVEYARSIEAFTVGFTAFDGGTLASIVDLPVHVPVNDPQVAQDVHMMIQHVALQALRVRSEPRERLSVRASAGAR